MNQEEYKKRFTPDDAVGWNCIEKQLKKIYAKQKPRHYAAAIGYGIGGPDPIDGTSIYNSHRFQFHRHLVSYGMSELFYNPEKAGGDFSKWGFEFTFRLKSSDKKEADPSWAIGLMNNLARYVYDSGRWFDENHFMPANGPINLDVETDIVGLVFTLDPELGKIQTPHGEVKFLQIVGITSKETERLLANSTPEQHEKLINELKKDNPLLITNLDRT